MEFYVVCQSCGKGFTYTDKDVKKNTTDAAINVLSSVGQIAGAFSGNWGGAIANKMNETELKDFSRCPNCGSHNLKHVSLEEFQRSQKKASGTVGVTINANASVEALIKRVKLLIEDQEWDTAEAYCNQILDQDPENAEVYLQLLLIENRVSSLEEAVNKKVLLRQNRNYNKLCRYADAELKEEVQKAAAVVERILQKEKEQQEEALKRGRYQAAERKLAKDEINEVSEALSIFQSLGSSYLDCSSKITACTERIDFLKAQKEQKKKRIKTKALICCAAVFVLLVAGVAVHNTRVYKEAVRIWDEGNHQEAIVMMSSIPTSLKASAAVKEYKAGIIEQLCSHTWCTDTYTDETDYGSAKYRGTLYLYIDSNGTAYERTEGIIGKVGNQVYQDNTYDSKPYNIAIKDGSFYFVFDKHDYYIDFDYYNDKDSIRSLEVTASPIYTLQFIVFFPR